MLTPCQATNVRLNCLPQWLSSSSARNRKDASRFSRQCQCSIRRKSQCRATRSPEDRRLAAVFPGSSAGPMKTSTCLAASTKATLCPSEETAARRMGLPVPSDSVAFTPCLRAITFPSSRCASQVPSWRRAMQRMVGASSLSGTNEGPEASRLFASRSRTEPPAAAAKTSSQAQIPTPARRLQIR